jgi:hypothetical protein
MKTFILALPIVLLAPPSLANSADLGTAGSAFIIMLAAGPVAPIMAGEAGQRAGVLVDVSATGSIEPSDVKHPVRYPTRK